MVTAETKRRGSRSKEQLEEQVSRLQARVDELEAALDEPLSTIHAIRTGLVDAVIIDRDTVPEVMTLESASEMYLRLAQRAAKVGTWQWNPATGELKGSEIFWSLIGEEPLDVAYMEVWEQHIPLEERQGFKAAVEAAIEHGSEFCCDLGVIGSATEARCLETRGCALRSAQDEARHVVGICLDITARKRAEEALRRADQRKDEFLATLGHELRNPLAAIKGAVQLLESDKVQETTQASVVTMLATQVAHMQRLVDDILDVARIVQDKINMRIETIELQDTIRQALAMVDGAVTEKECHLELRLPEDPIEIRGDSVRLTQVFANLFSNAVKYSESQCKIEIAAESRFEEAVVIVRDQGIGIAPELLPYVFDLFVQSKRSLDQSDGGLGLGLTVVKKLVAMHGGRVEAHSDGEGKGSEFRVYLPLAN